MLVMNQINYKDLNARQKENYNYHKVSAVLADYGYTTIRLSDDWQGADFVAMHISGVEFLRVQLKGRLTISKKYEGKQLHITFSDGTDWYLYPHDDVMHAILQDKKVGKTKSWDFGMYTFPKLGKAQQKMLEPYKVKSLPLPLEDYHHAKRKADCPADR